MAIKPPHRPVHASKYESNGGSLGQRGEGFSGGPEDFMPPPKPSSHAHMSSTWWAHMDDIDFGKSRMYD